MLEALVEAGAWLLRLTEDFKHSVIVLREARNVKYGSFMEPGRQCRSRWSCWSAGRDDGDVQGQGRGGGQTTVSARITLARYNLRDRARPGRRPMNVWLQHLRGLLLACCGDEPDVTASDDQWIARDAEAAPARTKDRRP